MTKDFEFITGATICGGVERPIAAGIPDTRFYELEKWALNSRKSCCGMTSTHPTPFTSEEIDEITRYSLRGL